VALKFVSHRYGRGSIALTTNLGIASRGRIFDDPTVAAAMLDLLLHRLVVFNIDGDSHRMRAHQARAEHHRKGVLAPYAAQLTSTPPWCSPGEFRCSRVGSFRDRRPFLKAAHTLCRRPAHTLSC
jgi:hypothetical protein